MSAFSSSFSCLGFAVIKNLLSNRFDGLINVRFYSLCSDQLLVTCFSLQSSGNIKKKLFPPISYRAAR